MTDWQTLKPHTGLVKLKFGEKMPETITVLALLTSWHAKDTLAYWRNHGRRHHPIMAKAAGIVLGATASAAQLERDYTDAGQYVTNLRERLGEEQVQMAMFCRAQGRSRGLSFNPDDLYVEKLGKQQVATVVPKRMSNPVAEIRLLDEDEEDRQLRELIEEQEAMEAVNARLPSARAAETAAFSGAREPDEDYDVATRFLSFSFWGGDERAAGRWDHNHRGPEADQARQGMVRPIAEVTEAAMAPSASRPRND